MAECTNILEKEIAVQGISVEVRTYKAPSEVIWRLYERHSLTTWLHPRSADIMAGIQDDLRRSSLHALNGLFYLPASRRAVAAHGRDNMARRIVVVRFAEERIKAVTGRLAEWDAECFLKPWFKDLEAIRRKSTRLAEEVLSPGFASGVLVEALGLELIVMLARGFQVDSRAESRRTGGLAGWQMRRLTDRINSAGDEPPTLTALADLVGLSARHLSRAFRLETGQTLSTYLQEVRIEQAQRLLSESSLPLKEISARLGFAVPQCFTTAFRRATGHTPSAYRRSAGREWALD